MCDVRKWAYDIFLPQEQEMTRQECFTNTVLDHKNAIYPVEKDCTKWHCFATVLCYRMGESQLLQVRTILLSGSATHFSSSLLSCFWVWSLPATPWTNPNAVLFSLTHSCGTSRNSWRFVAVQGLGAVAGEPALLNESCSSLDLDAAVQNSHKA